MRLKSTMIKPLTGIVLIGSMSTFLVGCSHHHRTGFYGYNVSFLPSNLCLNTTLTVNIQGPTSSSATCGPGQCFVPIVVNNAAGGAYTVTVNNPDPNTCSVSISPTTFDLSLSNPFEFVTISATPSLKKKLLKKRKAQPGVWGP